MNFYYSRPHSLTFAFLVLCSRQLSLVFFNSIFIISCGKSKLKGIIEARGTFFSLHFCVFHLLAHDSIKKRKNFRLIFELFFSFFSWNFAVEFFLLFRIFCFSSFEKQRQNFKYKFLNGGNFQQHLWVVIYWIWNWISVFFCFFLLYSGTALCVHKTQKISQFKRKMFA